MKRTLVVAVACLLFTGPAVAQSIQNVVLRNSFSPTGAGARGLGMGGAFIAVADDGTATSFNPAGLAQLRRTEFAIVGFTNQLTSVVQFPRGGSFVTDEDKARHSALDFVGLAVPFQVGGRNLNVQLSYQRSVDLFGRGRATIQQTVKLSDLVPGVPGVGDATIEVFPEQNGAFHTVSLSSGYQVTSRLALGFAVNYWFADWVAQGRTNLGVRIRSPLLPIDLEVPVKNTVFEQQQSFTGLSFNGGVLLKYSWISVGGILRFPFSSDYKLEESDTVTEFNLGVPLPSQQLAFRAVTPLSWPRSVGVGVAIRPFKRLTLAADFTHAQWSRTVIRNVPGGALLTPTETDAAGDPVDSFTDRNFFDLQPAPETFTQDTDSWHAGGEYLIVGSKVVIPLRGGIFRDRSPIIDLGTEEGRRIKGWTVGTGINFSHVVFDVAYERLESEGQLGIRLVRGEAVQTGLNVSTETVTQDRIVASLIYRFGGPDDPLKRLFRNLFVGPKEKEDN